ncbi:hypothetical protein CcaCcLH18_13092 [Colletotrichum camelliae]|nr:hypothetical protein CcaCcLH18_13092 [Colletotrichum camelliae]
MIPLPEDFDSWVAQVRQHNVGHLTLSQIRDAKRFSGSKIPHAAFLQLRAVWPPVQTPDKAVDALRRAGLIPDGYATGATAGRGPEIPVTGRSRPDEQCSLITFLSQIAANFPTTPIAQSEASSLSEAMETKLGSFGACLSLFRQLRPAPCARPDAVSSKWQIPPQTPPKLEKHGSDDSPDEDSSWFAACAADLMSDTPSKPPRGFKAPPPPPTNSVFVPPSEDEEDPPYVEEDSAERTTRKRTAYEVQTSMFFVPFLHALFLYRFSSSWSDHIQVAAEERQYKFGPSLFTACPDGAFYARSIPPEAFLFFELKPFRRVLCRDKICREETAEMAAILSQQLAQGKYVLNPLPSPQLLGDKSYNRLTISLNRDEYYITIVSYTASYLRYINNPNNVTYSAGLSNQDMIWFQSYGPFRLDERERMFDFCSLVTAVVGKQIRKSPGGAMLIDRLTANSRNVPGQRSA